MTLTLNIPQPPVIAGGQTINRPPIRFRLRWTTRHPQSSYGLGVVLDAEGGIVDGHAWRHLRSLGAWIEGEDVEIVARAMGVDVSEVRR